MTITRLGLVPISTLWFFAGCTSSSKPTAAPAALSRVASAERFVWASGDRDVLPTEMLVKSGPVETSQILQVDPASGCAQDPRSELRVCRTKKGINITPPEGAEFVLGGGQMLHLGHDSLSRHGLRIEPGNKTGNRMISFEGGAVGRTQIPFVQGIAADGSSWGLFLDHVEAITWDFSKTPWEAEMEGDIQGYLFAGTPMEVRRGYMALTGHPPLPPKAAFGLWLSEYGFDSFEEADTKLGWLQEADFPVDGLIFDLQWFGGVGKASGSRKHSRMGALTWDEEKFPSPWKSLAALKEKHDVEAVHIEESYIADHLPEHTWLAEGEHLVKDRSGKDGHMKSWWGMGAMLDWSNPQTRATWHEAKRQSLVEGGFLGHWTDLGEPEDAPKNARYHGGAQGRTTHAQAHNLYNWWWSQGIFEAYRKHHPTKRPWVLSRSTTAGGQRFGVGMWSGDIGSNLRSLRAHHASQPHMAASGIDYYGSDVGGFWRKEVKGKELDTLYTQWFALSALMDIPVRPHVMNVQNIHKVSPAKVGDTQSNLQAIRERYALTPYYYSLGYAAWKEGTPIFPPAAYFFAREPAFVEADVAEHNQAALHQRMIGPWLMTSVDLREPELSMVLPDGQWWDFRTGEPAACATTKPCIWKHRAWSEARFQPPLLARAGSIIPTAPGTMRAAAAPQSLVVKIFPTTDASEFLVYNDDGITNAYQQDAGSSLKIRQTRKGDELTIELSSKGALPPITLALPKAATLGQARIDGDASEAELEHEGPWSRLPLGSDVPSKIRIRLAP